MCKPTREEVRASIVPKSDQLNADDLVTGPITVTIIGVKRGNREQPIVVELDGLRPYKPCKTMRRVLIAILSDDPKQWIGQKLRLYCDTNVTWAGVKVGGIRISHISGISEPKTFLLTRARGKKSEVTILPLTATDDAKPTPDEIYIADARAEIQRADTLQTLAALGFIFKTKSTRIQDAVRDQYARRKKELEVKTTNSQNS